MTPSSKISNSFKRLKDWQKSFQAKVLNNPNFKWYQRGVWLLSLSWAAVLTVQSVPFYSAIGIGESAYKRGDYATAEIKFKEALKESEQYAPTDLRRAKIYNNLAELYRTTYKFDLAEPFYDKSVAIARKLGNNHPELPMSLNNLATLYRDQGLYSKSESTFREALSIWDMRIKRDDLNRAAILNGTGKILRDEGKYSEAEKYYKQALSIKEKTLGANDADNSVVLNNLGGVYRDQGKYSESEEYYLRALTIDRAAHGDNHPYTATDLNNLAGLYRDQNRLDESDALYKQALEIRAAVLGSNHPVTAKTMLGMAELASKRGDFDAAQRLLERAVAIQSKTLGPDHPEIATTYNLMGNLFLSQHKAVAACKMQNMCIAIREKKLSPTHPDMGIALIDRGRAEELNADPKESNRDLDRGKQILTNALGVDHPVTKRTLAGVHASTPKT
ncbi:MAG: tetratricopeptide repeat protein [Candidatus Melainabacteria bacterium]|nr:tetratricopeptide repeat protein [Candidatus Melainabacteria bacterium]